MLTPSEAICHVTALQETPDLECHRLSNYEQNVSVSPAPSPHEVPGLRHFAIATQSNLKHWAHRDMRELDP